jgi:uncharacterized membrane protein
MMNPTKARNREKAEDAPLKTSIAQTIFRIVLGASLIFTGLGHLTWARVEFLAQVPPWVPLEGDLLVILSGIVEIVLGAALIIWVKQRVLLGLATAVFFILIFPGNIAQYVNQIDAFGLDSDRARFVRLFFQPLLVVWALWSTGAWRALRAGDWQAWRRSQG